MNFFEHQEIARRRTSELIAYYGLALVLIIAAIYGVALLIFAGAAGAEGEFRIERYWIPELFGGVAVGVGLILGVGTLYKVAELSRGGGAAVAEMLGGTPIPPNTRDFETRRLLNVVEEMALASGVPMPRVYVLEEEGINAFAAGLTPADAVIGVTRGCLKALTRDELQAVMAHEFSHILNGDMRLNLRLIGVLHGLLIIALLGYGLFRIFIYSGSGSRSRSSSRGKKEGNLGVALALFGLALMIIGYIGVFFGRLIKSAVSRQREFLADASSVQFTRNPQGLAGALKKIAGFAAAGRIQNDKAEEASHLFFANGLAAGWFSLLATHPPLEERIRRIDPGFDGRIPEFHGRRAPDKTEERVSALAGSSLSAAPPPVPAAARKIQLRPARLREQVGAMEAGQLAAAARLLDRLPARARERVRETEGAQALIFSLLIGGDADLQNRQMAALAARDSELPAAVREWREDLARMTPDCRLPLADLAVAALRGLTPGQYESFRDLVLTLSGMDQAIDLFEYALLRTLVRRLDPLYRKVKRPAIQVYQVHGVAPAAVDLLATLAWTGNPDGAAAAAAFRQGLMVLAEPPTDLPPAAECTLTRLDQALDRLLAASHPVRGQVLEACAACVAHDGEVTVEEGELLRAIADSLECPIPPYGGAGPAAEVA